MSVICNRIAELERELAARDLDVKRFTEEADACRKLFKFTGDKPLTQYVSEMQAELAAAQAKAAKWDDLRSRAR